MNRKELKPVLYLIMLSLMIFFLLPEAMVHAAASESVMVFAAASTTNAVTEIGERFKSATKIAVVPSFASSSALAKQIENGAPAAVFISADNQWMDYLQEKKLIDPTTRSGLLSNRIVLVAPADSPLKMDMLPGLNLSGALGENRLAMGDPDHVPAGIYGKKALETLGVWESVKDRIARTNDVRSALVLVERGESPLGIVYATDAAITAKVRIAGIFPENTHPPIVYPVALVAGNKTAAAEAFLAFLKGREARAIFEKYGFSMR
ncbi:MAG: molybdate ABC transporter substrate-binding protein [Desulfobacterales bacterium]|jgi:molybdate transport system substrate-binding protein|nr:molybdate ABC transporter substrate-binding protein [Desulfobacterales bacterium]